MPATSMPGTTGGGACAAVTATAATTVEATIKWRRDFMASMLPRSSADEIEDRLGRRLAGVAEHQHDTTVAFALNRVI